MKDPDSATISNMALTSVWHTEFRTSSMLFNIGACSTPLHDYHASVLAVSTFPMFTENWIHVPTILNWLRTNIPKALSAVSVAGYRVVKEKPKQQAKPQIKVVTAPQPKRVAGPKRKTVMVKVKKTK